ncbi:MAG: hypothetical protein CMJ46_15775 [Planctomyces sp.]|nr:hypothetical protein [Planctomyces sp.]
MSSVLNVLTSSFPAGTLFHARVRVAYSLPIFFLLVLLRNSDDLLIGMSLILIFTGSVLFQQLVQMLVARRTGGEVNEILLWPLGTLARMHLGFRMKSRVVTWFSTPLTYMLVCMLIFPFIYRSFDVFNLIDIAALPISQYTMQSFSQLGQEFLALTFFVNFWLMMINILPALPLAAGRITEELLLGNFNSVTVNRVVYGITTFTGFLFLLTGVAFSHVWVALFGTVLVCWTLYEKIRLLETSPTKDESELFLGYDFSAGYTSLERSREEHAPQPPRPGVLARWRARRRSHQQRKADARRRAAQEQIDSLLQKVSESGLSSLSASEHKQLKQASQYLRPEKQK